MVRLFCATLMLLFVVPASADDTTPIRRSAIRNTSSSKTAAGGDLKLALKNLSDGVGWSSWAGDLAGGDVWFEVEFVGTRYLSKLAVTPGCAGSGRTFEQYGRPKEILLESEGRTVALELKDRRRQQSFQIDPPLPATRLRVRTKSWYPGQRNAVCFSEVALHELTAMGQLDEGTRMRLEEHAERLGDADAASTAVISLVAIGPAAVPRLAVALTDESVVVQSNALRALHRIGAPSSAAALMKYWKAGPPADLAPLALEAMARTGDSAVIPIIVAAMQGDDLELADRAASTVGSFGAAMLPALEPLLDSEHIDIAERAVRAMQHIADPRVIQLARRFCRSRRASHRAAAAQALGAAPCADATKALLGLSRDPHPNVRVAVAAALAAYPDDDSTLILARLLRDRDEYVAHRALDALADKPSGPKHLAAYLNLGRAPLGAEVIMMLARTGGDVAIRVLIDGLRRGDTRFRRAMQDGLSAIGPEAVIRLVDAAVIDRSLRADCEEVLALHPDLAVHLVGEVVAVDPGSTPSFLLRALARSAAPGSLEVLDRVWKSGAPSLRIKVVQAWSRYPAERVRERLLGALQSADLLLRIEAARSAAAAGVTEVAPLLTEALESQAVPAEVAIDALGQLRSSAGVPFMIERFSLGDMSLRVAILKACARIQSRTCIELLYNATQDRDAAIRAEATRLLSE